MKKEYVFKSFNDGTSKVIIEDNKLTIIRPGFLSKLSHGFTGEKTLLINNISSVQFKKVGLARGYIQFILIGSKEAKSGIVLGARDENVIYFDARFNNKVTNANAIEIKNYIEEFNCRLNNGNTKSEDNYDKILKLKNMLDNDAITKEEYEREKERLLNS